MSLANIVSKLNCLHQDFETENRITSELDHNNTIL